MSATSEYAPDFGRPGDSGQLPDDFREWHSGVTCTVRPALLHPAPARRAFRLNTTVRRTAATGEAVATYADLYDRATSIVHARAARLTCIDPAAVARTWILAHAWFSHDIGTKRIHSATVTLGVSFGYDDDPQPTGESGPEAGRLLMESGGSPESFAAKHHDATGATHVDELYVDFAESAPGPDVTVSYGEYVADCASIDFGPIVARAEAVARFHCERWSTPIGPDAVPVASLRREWRCLATGKISDALIATVHIYLRR